MFCPANVEAEPTNMRTQRVDRRSCIALRSLGEGHEPRAAIPEYIDGAHGDRNRNASVHLRRLQNPLLRAAGIRVDGAQEIATHEYLVLSDVLVDGVLDRYVEDQIVALYDLARRRREDHDRGCSRVRDANRFGGGTAGVVGQVGDGQGDGYRIPRIRGQGRIETERGVGSGIAGRAGPVELERSSTGSVSVAVGVHRDHRAVWIARFNAAPRVQWILERDLRGLDNGHSRVVADLAEQCGPPAFTVLFPVDCKLSNRAGGVPNDLQHVKATGDGIAAASVPPQFELWMSRRRKSLSALVGTGKRDFLPLPNVVTGLAQIVQNVLPGECRSRADKHENAEGRS